MFNVAYKLCRNETVRVASILTMLLQEYF